MKKAFSFILITLLSVVLIACGNNSSNKEEKTSKNDTKNESKTVEIQSKYQARGEKQDESDAKTVDEKVTVPVNPKKVVVLDYGALDTVEALGAKDAVKGVPKGEGNATLPAFLKAFKGDEVVNTGSLKEVNYEKIAEIQPDLILFSGRTSGTKVQDELKKAAPDAARLYIGADDKKLLKSVKTNTTNLGKIFDKESKAKSLNADLDKKVKSTQDKAEKSDDKAMYLLVNEGELSTYGPGARFGSLIYDVLGVKTSDDNIKASRHGQPISYEYITKKNPDIIYAMDRGKAIGGKESSNKALSNDVIKDVNAIKNQKVINVDPELWYLASGGVRTTEKQIDEVAKGLK
ncbi:ferrated catecholamine ABC transporter substrate-binding lipoprotein SstD [Mammaliicoccus sp. Dog046]|uniref:ferrated catecholamine ABC transporter substrate-binding lipoprotein SstD n=1 Tax=Mammaliicoccus sp. Dog046 TaxID=3034233 RepID=UPI002B25BABF|nr:ABC transporter substrate-binding protein [Mammaliicoccus sp. Dog046]WQK85020.1 ABC transporter substrate-binding protein [Mammaliicoccus sp. Dog046]